METTNTKRSDVLRASPRMFESDFLDFFTRVHPVVPVIIFLPAIVLFAVLGFRELSLGTALLCAVGGYLFWTLSEYWIHRVIFHFEPDHPLGRRLHWIMHGVHHDHPNDPLRLVMPPSVSVPLGALFLGAFLLVLGTPHAWAVAAGFFGGYLFYDMTHYYVHHFRPKTRVGKWLRELHMRHHFQDATRAFGISAPWWDYVFRTHAERKKRRS
jgi:sterol desaturase/sphingolipid hydroxylase (fatty acid hydroxylase superfamily)